MSLIVGKRVNKEPTICEVIEYGTKNTKGMNELKQTMLFDNTLFDRFYKNMYKDAYCVTPKDYPDWSAISFYCAKYRCDFEFLKDKFKRDEFSNSNPITQEDYEKIKEINTGGNISLDIFNSLPVTPVYTISQALIPQIERRSIFEDRDWLSRLSLQCPALIILCPSGALKVSDMGHIEFVLLGVTKNSRVSFICITSTGMALHVYQIPIHELENCALSNFIIQALINVVKVNHPIEEWDKTTRNKKLKRYPYRLG